MKLSRLFQKGGRFESLGLSRLATGVHAITFPLDKGEVYKTGFSLQDWQHAWWQRPETETAHTLALFVCCARSGHSLIGALLSAHPQVRIGHESNALHVFQRMDGKFPPWGLYECMVNSNSGRIGTQSYSREEVYRGVGEKFAPGIGGYGYEVEGFDQQAVERLQVIGFKAGESTAKMLGKYPDLIDRIVQHTGLRLRLFHTVRNPYDMIATRLWRAVESAHYGRGELEAARATNERRRASLKGEGSFDELLDLKDFQRQVDEIEACARVCADCMTRYDQAMLTSHHEDFVHAPESGMEAMVKHVGLEMVPGYGRACAKIVNPEISLPRWTLTWTDEMRAQVEDRLIASFAFFHHYSLEESDEQKAVEG